jgi:hypothetical protein
MAKDSKTVIEVADPKGKVSKTAAPRAMSLEKAKKLIRKTSAEHEGLFRRLAK